jgi:hypothetical protein
MGGLWNTVTQYVKLYFRYGQQPVLERPDVDDTGLQWNNTDGENLSQHHCAYHKSHLDF